MSVRILRCTVADPAAAFVYDGSADYRESCLHSHDTQGEHLCELLLRARSTREPAVPSTVCDIASVPTSVLAAIQTKLRDLLGRSATTSNQDHGQAPLSIVP
jgi:hypothetical protein